MASNINRWTDQEINLLKKEYGTKLIQDINLPGRSYEAKRTRIKILGLKYKNYSRDEDQIITDLYPHSEKQQILERLPNRNWNSIRNRACVLSVKRKNFQVGPKRIYHVNDDFFKILNVNNCYWGGFLAGDGCLQKNNNVIKIGVNIRDVEILDNLQKDIMYDGHYWFNKSDNTYRLDITSKIIRQDLCQHFNITPCKSLTLESPNIDDIHQKIAFIVGFIDANGSIGYINNYRPNLQIYGTENVLVWIKNVIDELFPFSLFPLAIKNAGVYPIKGVRCFKYALCGKRASTFCLHALNIVKNYVSPLKRKWNHVLEWQNV